MRGFRSRTAVVLVGVGLLAGCAEAGTAPMAGTAWRAPAAKPPASSHTTSAVPKSTSAKTSHRSKPSKPSERSKPSKPSKQSKPLKPSSGRHLAGPAGSATRTGGAGVALTFDDGPDPVQTPRMLNLLARYHVKATFCVVGKNVEAHPELVRRIVADGHTLCNHSWRHSLTLGRQSSATIRADLQRTNEAIRHVVPDAKIAYLRAPGGNFTPRFVQVATAMGMTSIYWEVDPRDWDHPKDESSSVHRARIIAAVEKHAHKGSIVLSHDFGQPDTIAAYRILIPWLKTRYHLVALPH